MRILWINPVGTAAFDADTVQLLERARGKGTEVEVVSLPADRPQHLKTCLDSLLDLCAGP